jgi:hypothetical protein
MASWRRRRASDISVLWADFGQGKTHALLHVETSLISLTDTLVHYVQLPPLTAGSPFVALYRQVLRDFPLDIVGKRVFARYRDSIQDIFRAPPPGTQPIHQLLWLIGTAAPGREIASRWLRGDKVTTGETSNLVIAGKRLAVGASPQTAQDCQNVLDSLLQTAIDFPSDASGQFVLLIDEFQRLGELTSRKRTEVCDALHLLFNRHPQGLRLVLAFAGGLPEIVDNVLTRDLQARVSSRLHLPPMTQTQAEAYLVDLVEQYCGTASKGIFPYARDAVSAIVELADPDDDSLSPRRLNIAADMLTNEALDDRAVRGDVTEHPITRQEVLDAAHVVEDQLSMSLAAID